MNLSYKSFCSEYYESNLKNQVLATDLNYSSVSLNVPTKLRGAIRKSGSAKHSLMTLWRSGSGLHIKTAATERLRQFFNIIPR